MLNKLLREASEKSLNRHICKDSRGRYFIISRVPSGPEKAGFCIQMSKKTPPCSMEDFSQPVRIRISENNKENDLVSAGISEGKDGRLYLACSNTKGAVRLSCADIPKIDNSTSLKHKGVWENPVDGNPGFLTVSGENSAAGDIVSGEDGSVLLGYKVEDRGGVSSVFIGRLFDAKWQNLKIGEGSGFFPPVLFIDDRGVIHAAWHNVREELFYSTIKATSKKTSILCRASRIIDRARFPAMSVFKNGKPVIAYENNWSFIEYVEPDDRNARKFLTWPDARFSWDVSHSPQFAFDSYGIPWLFFIDSTRRLVFFSRFLGGNWDNILNGPGMIQNTPRFDNNHLIPERLSVEGNSNCSDGIGILISKDSGNHYRRFHRMGVPSLTSSSGRKVLFFDLLELREKVNVDLNLNTAKKYSDNPVISSGGDFDFDRDGAGSFLRVLKQNGRYRMWYAGKHYEKGKYWRDWMRIGYAESSNGKVFKKPKLGYEFFGNDNGNNLLQRLPYVPMVYFDSEEKRDERKYKLLEFYNHNTFIKRKAEGVEEDCLLQEAYPGVLYVSPDGLRWKKEKAVINFPAGRPFSFTPQCLFYDPFENNPEKKYKAYGYTSLNLSKRGGGYAYSPDCLNWTYSENNPVLDSYARGIPVVAGGKIEQIHDMAVWPRDGYYIALYQHQKTGENLDVELAVSRDGENFIFVLPGKKLIENGEKGCWDDSIVTSSIPFEDVDEIKLYYGGIDANGKGGGGLASLRLDGLTCLQLAKENIEGSICTIPIEPGGAENVYINADCGRNGFLQAEIIDSKTLKPLAGFERKDSRKITGDSTRHKLVWRNRAGIGSIKRKFSVKINFRGDQGFPRLYSLYFSDNVSFKDK